jgi:hypothetical protein
LPAILRRLTLIETTSQSQIWAFLSHLRSFIRPRDLFAFLMNRFTLSPHEVDHYASTVRQEDYDPDAFGLFFFFLSSHEILFRSE